MLDQLTDWFRKLSLILLLVSGLVVAYTEAFSDIPIGRHGRPKPPIARQRMNYAILIAVALPGSIWAIVRTIRGQQRTWWE